MTLQRNPTLVYELPERGIADAKSKFPARTPSHVGCAAHLKCEYQEKKY